MKIPRLADTGEWTTRRYLSLLGTVLIWIIVAIDAWYLWPTQLGGDTSIVVVSGSSMEPTFYGGDMVIARKTEPSVGDAIVYAPEDLDGSQIVHRIIGGNADEGWQMQGDNNDFVDPFTPKGAEVKGVVLVHYSNFGRVTVLLLNPMVWAFVLLAAMVLMLWYTGDDCDDDDDDEATNKDDVDPESEVEDEPDLIDRMVEGTEAAVSRMVASGAAAGTAAFAALTRPSPSPRHAAPVPRHAAPSLRFASPAYLRASAIVATLGLLAVFGPSTASASQLPVNTAGQASVTTDVKCATQNLTVTPSGTHTNNAYGQVTVSGIAAACLNQPISVYLHSSTGAIIATFSGTTPASGSTMTLTLAGGATFDASQVTEVVVKVGGWLFVAAWTYTAGPPPFPAPGQCDGVLLTTGQLATGTTCNLTTISDLYYYGTYWNPVYVLVVDASTQFTPAGNYQNLTKWRFTLNLTTLAYSGYLGNLNTQFHVYQYGNQNVVVAPGETCSNPSSVTFQEDIASTNPGATLVVSRAAIPGWDSELICQGP